MIANDISLEQLKSEIAPILTQWHDSVEPAKVELLPNFGYSPVYAWMFSYEKQLKYRIEEASGRKLSKYERGLFGADGVFSEALSNAFVHGHRRDPDITIDITTVVGSKGLVFSIHDRGKGFEVDHIVTAASDGGRYFNYGGNGLRVLCQREDVTAFYSEKGRLLHMKVILWNAEA